MGVVAHSAARAGWNAARSASVVPGFVRLPCYFCSYALVDASALQDLPALAGSYFHPSRALRDDGADLSLCAAGIRFVPAFSCHTPLHRRSISLALRAEASPFSALRPCVPGMGARLQELQDPGRSGGRPGRQLPGDSVDRSDCLGRLCADDAHVWNRRGVYSLPGHRTAALAQSRDHVAPVSAESAGLRLGARLFLAPPPRVGLDEGRQPADAGFDRHCALLLALRSGLGYPGPAVRRLCDPLPDTAGGFCLRVCPDPDRAGTRHQSTVGLLSLDGARVACMVSAGRRLPA